MVGRIGVECLDLTVTLESPPIESGDKMEVLQRKPIVGALVPEAMGRAHGRLRAYQGGGAMAETGSIESADGAPGELTRVDRLARGGVVARQDALRARNRCAT